jgi:hypothetical protein
MKQMALVETLRRLFRVVVTAWFVPLLLYAQAFDTTPPVIGHQPQKLGRQGKPMPLSVLIADPSGIKSVQLKISYEGESFEGPMPVINENESVPVTIKILSDQLPVYAGPGIGFKKLGVLFLDEQVQVTMVRDGFYRITSGRGIAGYIAAGSTETLLQGKLYGVTVPANITQSAFLTYQIIAIDAFGNEAKTNSVEVRLIDDKQLAKLQTQAGITPRPSTAASSVKPLSSRRSSPFYKKPVFWLATLAVGGGAYYYYSQQDDKEKDASVNLILEW